MRRIQSKELNEETIRNYIPRGAENLSELAPKVKEIIDEVRKGGEKAIINFNLKFSKFDPGVDLFSMPFKIPTSEIEEAYSKVSNEVVEALKKAKINIEKFHKAQLPKEWMIEQMPGVSAGQIFRPIESVGLYVPGGEGAYPSSVLMTAIPALAAGVPRLVLVSPPKSDGKLSPAVLVAADIVGIKEIYRVGGAQAIALLAYGTTSIKPVLKIMGPGNKWVNTAKQLVAGTCAIDTPAGPSEILIIADNTARVEDLLLDFTAQIEHGPDNVGVLVSDCKTLLDEFESRFNEYVKSCKRASYIESSAQKFALIVDTENLEDSIRVSNMVAPEHLHIQTADPKAVIQKINNAGAIFLGRSTPVALGDYCGGTNHVLPTSGYAKMYSGLSTMEFMKAIDILEVNENGLESLEPILRPIADYEGFYQHRDSVTLRVKKIRETRK